MRTSDTETQSHALPDLPGDWSGVKTFVEIVRGSRFDAARAQLRMHAPDSFAELETLELDLRTAADAHRLTEPLDDGVVPMMERILQIIAATASSEGVPEDDTSAAVVEVTIHDRRAAALGALSDSPDATVTA